MSRSVNPSRKPPGTDPGGIRQNAFQLSDDPPPDPALSLLSRQHGFGIDPGGCRSLRRGYGHRDHLGRRLRGRSPVPGPSHSPRRTQPRRPARSPFPFAPASPRRWARPRRLGKRTLSSLAVANEAEGLRLRRGGGACLRVAKGNGKRRNPISDAEHVHYGAWAHGSGYRMP